MESSYSSFSFSKVLLHTDSVTFRKPNLKNYLYFIISLHVLAYLWKNDFLRMHPAQALAGKTRSS
jgi:hypothetical protein